MVDKTGLEDPRQKVAAICDHFDIHHYINPIGGTAFYDKEEWRAVVVHVEDENDMMEFGRSRYNPYDFDVNAELQPYGESKVPLIIFADDISFDDDNK